MNTIISFGVQIVLTFLISVLLVRYLRPFLRNVLRDLCGTEERAEFWTVFSSILLVGLPLVFALNYRSEAVTIEKLFFEMAGKLSGNLAGMLLALIGIGLMVSFFALVAPKSKKVEVL